MHEYSVTATDRVRAFLLASFVLVCDLALKVIARIGAACSGIATPFDALKSAFDRPEGCTGTEMAGPSIVLLPHAQPGVLLGMIGTFEGLLGQLWALGLLCGATVATILVTRWDARSNADPRALACIWAGALALAAPRFWAGVGLAELVFFGASFGVGALAVMFGVAWMIVRVVAEWRG